MIYKKPLPLIPLRDVVIFPGIIVPIVVGRKKSMKAISASQELPEISNNNTINIEDISSEPYVLVTSQRKQNQDEPKPNDLYDVGIRAKIIQTVKLPSNNAKVLVEGLERVRLFNITRDEFFTADYETLPDAVIAPAEELKAAIQETANLFRDYAKNNKKIHPDILNIISEQNNLFYVPNIIASHLNIAVPIKQELLEETDIMKRIKFLQKIITAEITKMDTEQALQERVKAQIEKTQKEYYLNEQMKAIQKELDGGENKSDFMDLQQKIDKLPLSKEAKEKSQGELKKLRLMNQMSAESSVIRNYLDTLLGMPWGKFDNPNINIEKAEGILNRDHFGLEKVKERIIEYLAVLKRSKKIKGPILCLIGPPGVGKTSLVKSIAEAMGRKYVKFALGGVRDEAEVRGHRRTYLGSMPGKIISLLKKVKVNNPVMLLDEIDKIGSDFRGDPTSALLEVLDPEQNSHFTDHYLEVEYDLSDVVFIATANSYNFPRPLMDRMEIINIAGYVEEEKLQIAKNYLIPKQLKLHNMKENELTIEDSAVLDIIRYYTKESGVRSLERELGSLARKVLKRILSDKTVKSVAIVSKDLEDYLGVKKYRFSLAETEDMIGSTTGLAYTEVGGDLLTIEAVSFPGKGEIKTTGKLGDVMKESVQAAYSCFRKRAGSKFGLKLEDYKDLDIHLHVPEGAIPKDGPSAGTAIFTTIVSLMTGKAVKSSVAMTGEITLSGKVLPIGGLKEKLLAASRGGIKTVLIPEDNVKDLKDIPGNIKDKLQILPVANIDQVLDIALVR